jgi:hypothetical protein
MEKSAGGVFVECDFRAFFPTPGLSQSYSCHCPRHRTCRTGKALRSQNGRKVAQEALLRHSSCQRWQNTRKTRQTSKQLEQAVGHRNKR